MMPNEKLPQLPKLPPNMEWVIHALPDRFTINLSYTVPDPEINPEVDPEFTEDDGENRFDSTSGYVMSHTHKHQAVITREDWEAEVCAAAHTLWSHFTEGNRHAKWADELMRRNR